MQKLLDWLDERTGLRPHVRYFLYRKIPHGTGWFHTLGSATLFLILVQVVTGLFLTLHYVPSTTDAYQTILMIENSVLLGAVVRGIHHWSANFLVVIMVLHLLRVIFWGAYKKPRELTWLIGVAMLGLVLGLSFTGYLLPWDQKAYWATVVGTEIMGTVPLVGPWLMEIARGGLMVGPQTLSRFFSAHALWLPGMLLLLIGAHLALVIKHGIAPPPERSLLRTERRPDGFSFYPHHLSKDVLSSCGLFAVILYLAVAVGAPLDAPADSSSVDVLPKPEWYFLSLYRFLWLLPGKYEVVGTFVVPGLIFLGLILLPFVDTGWGRHPAKRPVIIGTSGMLIAGAVYLTVIGLTAPKPPGSAPILVGHDLPPSVATGLKVYQDYGCMACHVVDGVGVPAGPSLDQQTRAKRSREYLTRFILDPQEVRESNRMPGYEGEMSRDELEALVDFLFYLEGRYPPPVQAAAVGR